MAQYRHTINNMLFDSDTDDSSYEPEDYTADESEEEEEGKESKEEEEEEYDEQEELEEELIEFIQDLAYTYQWNNKCSLLLFFIFVNTL